MPIGEMSRFISLAILASEDDEFYSHPGFDIGGIIKAFCHATIGDFGGICPARGGSTITQQMVKNFFLTNERTIARKTKEIVLANRIERKFSKDQILEIYLNGISFGADLNGVETASQAFFRKSAKDITLAEAAILAALPQSPSRLSPNGERAFSHVLISPEIIAEKNYETFEDIDRLPGMSWMPGLVGREVELANGKKAYFPGRADDYVLKRMVGLGYINEQEYQQARQELLTITFPEYRANITAPHFVMMVKEELETMFGADLVEYGGLKVTTTLDNQLQKLAEEAAKKYIEKNSEQFNAKNAAIISLDTKTGEIRALVGSADYWNQDIDGNVNIILKKRLPGSSFKPITYAAAFAAGKLSPGRILFDVQTNFGNDWIPKNFDGGFRGPVSVRYALGNSLNIPAIKAAIIAGPEKVYELATKMGISFDFPADFYGAAIAIGGAEARPIDMAKAFAIFANNGKNIEPSTILRVEDRFGNLLYAAEAPKEVEQILDPGIAYQITNMLADPGARGPGWNSHLQMSGRENMVKTGTADKKVKDVAWPSDTWTIGATPQLTTAVWSGNSDGSVLAKNASGFEIAAPIWLEYMNNAHQHLPVEKFAVPPGISRIQVSKLSGLLPAADTDPNLITGDIASSINMPTQTDNSLQFIEIDSVSGKLPTDLTPPDARKKVAVLTIHDYYPDWPNWETPVQAWLVENKVKLLETLGVKEGDVLTEVPTESDNVHTQQSLANAPTVRFDYPGDGDQVASPRTTVDLDISTANGFEKVLLYWDGRLLKVFENEEKNGYVIPVPPDENGRHTIRAQVFDTLQYMAESSVNVEITEDSDKPEVEFTQPRDNTTLAGGAEVLLAVNATDRYGAIKKVEFYIDETRIGADLFPPFEMKWPGSNENGQHTLRAVATDYTDNTGEASITIQVEQRADSTSFGITDPKNGDTKPCGESITITASVAGETKDNFDRLEIWASYGSQQKNRLAEFSEISATGFFETTTTLQECGEWRFYTKVFLDNGAPRISPSTFVTFASGE